MPNTKLSIESDTLLSDNMLLFWEHDEKTYMCHIKPDCEPANPRRSDTDNNLATLACFHSRHIGLGDGLDTKTPSEFWEGLVRKHVENNELLAKIRAGQIDGFEQIMPEQDIETIDPDKLLDVFYGAVSDGEIKYAMAALNDRLCWLHMWLYDHSGLTISCGERTAPFNDPWDSSCIGWAVMDKNTAMSELAADERNWREKAVACIKSEVASYDKYLTGDIWMYALYASDRPIGENECGKYPNGNTCSDNNSWGDTIDETCGFEGPYLMASGIPQTIGCGLPEALAAGKYWTGTANARTIVVYNYIRNA